MNKKLFGIMVSVAVLTFAVSGSAGAQSDWKWERKVTFISPWGPGGGSGPTIRNITPLVREVIKVPTEVQHIEGAGGANGAIAANRQPADGYTYLLASQSHILMDLQKIMPFDFHEQFVPVAKLVHSTNAIIASKKTMKDRYSDIKSFIAYVKANPKAATVAIITATGSDGASFNQAMSELLGVPINKVQDYVKLVNYSGGSEVDAALVGGHVDVGINGPGDVRGLIESGDVVPLVIMAEKRMASFPDIPSTGEMGLKAYIGTWRGIFAKKGTPQAAIDSMEKALREAWNMKPYQDYWKAEGYSDRTGFEGQADFKKLEDSEYQIMGDYLKGIGIIK
jgi:tripartite-type tricarboxylate transporter receptor subunit TctC